MWTPFQRADLPPLLAGAAIAAAAGLLLGSALHPDLGADGLMAPQTQVAGGGPRDGGGGGGDPGLSRYEGRVPEHVIGTDWTRPPALVAEAPPIEAESAPVQVARPDAPHMQTTAAAWREPPRESVAYPSDSGGVVYETDLPPPPPPPVEHAPD